MVDLQYVYEGYTSMDNVVNLSSTVGLVTSSQQSGCFSSSLSYTNANNFTILIQKNTFALTDKNLTFKQGSLI